MSKSSAARKIEDYLAAPEPYGLGGQVTGTKADGFTVATVAPLDQVAQAGVRELADPVDVTFVVAERTYAAPDKLADPDGPAGAHAR